MISRLKRLGVLAVIFRKALRLPFFGWVRRRIKTSGTVRFISASGLFDRDGYVQKYSDVAGSGIDPALHYVLFGVTEGRDPHPLFASSYYLERNPDVGRSGLNPLEHYLHSGAREGRSPHPLFDTSFYLERNPDVAEAGVNPLIHFLLTGGSEGRSPHPLFDTGYYLKQNLHLVKAERNALVDFVTVGHLQGRNPHPLFDTDFYRRANPDVAATAENPLVHFLLSGASEGRNPHPLFDVGLYRERLPEAEASGWKPLLHYLASAVGERPDPHPLFDVPFYLEQRPELVGSDIDPLVHYLEVGAGEGSDPHPLFRTSYYLLNNPEVAVSSINPLAHFVVAGGAEGKNPCPLFDTRYYLSRHPDADPQDPLGCFLRHGLSREQNPHPLFDTAFYVQNTPEVVTLGVNPLEHFVTVGWVAGCNPHPLFDVSYYLRRNPEVAASGENPLEHYLRTGAAGFLDPHPLIDTRYVSEQNTEVESSPLTPLGYYLEKWSTKGLNPHPLFDTAYYFEKNPALGEGDVQPLIHYLTAGAAEGRNPCPWFDRDYYERRYPQAVDGDPLTHFLTEGLAAGLNPSAGFVTSFYLQEYPDVAELGMNPLVHYVLFGKDEERSTTPTSQVVRSKGLVVFSSSAYLGGANQIALAIVREAATHHPDLRVSAVLCHGGPLEEEFARYAQVMNLESLAAESGSREAALERVIGALQGRKIYSAILNTVVTGHLAERLKQSGFEVVGLIHELVTSIDVFKWTHDAEGHAKFADRIVFPAQMVRESYCRRFSVPEKKTRIHSQGLLKPNPYLGDKDAARAWVRTSLGLPDNARVVLGCGYADLRKGLDIYRDVAQIVCRSPEMTDVHFVWLGDGDDVACGWFRHDLERSGLKERVHFLGHVDDPYRYFAGADLFLLTSREDPFPTVNLEAMEAGLPVVAFRGSGGAEEILAGGCGVLVPYGAAYEMAGETIRLLLDENERRRIGRRASRKVEETQSLSDYVRFLRSLFGNLPKAEIAAPRPRLADQRADEARLNVLVVIGDFDVGGGQMFAIRLANALSERCNVFCTNARPELTHPEITALFRANVRILDNHGGPESLARLIAEHNVDVVNSHIWWADKLSFLALKKSSTPWFITMHGCYEHLLDHASTDPAFPSLVKEMLSRADGVLYPADKNLRVFRALGLRHEEKTEKIYYGLDPSEYRATSQPVELDLGEDPFVAGIVSRAIAKKGWEQAIEAVLRINAGRRRDERTVHLILVGESDYSQELGRKYRDESTIHFVGHSKRPASWIATFDVGLLPSYFESESLPNTVIEYLACGKPTIATEIGEIPHMLVAGETAAGTLIALTKAGLPNMRQLTQAIRRYLRDDDLLRSHAKNTEILFRQFSIDTCAERYVQAFSQVIDQPKTRSDQWTSGISVVIPLYDHARYIRAAVESVLAQSVAADEIIIIDDGSKDRSAQVARALAGEYDHIRFWSRENRGAHATINEGIEAARGKYVAILNSDDLYHPERFAECLAAMRADAAPDVVFTRVAFVDGEDQPQQHGWYDEAVDSYLATRDLPLSLLRCNFFMTTTNVFARKAVLDRVGGFANLRYAHDLDWFVRLLLEGVPTSFINRPLLSYRWHSANTIAEDDVARRVEHAAILALFAERVWRRSPKAVESFEYIRRISEIAWKQHAYHAYAAFLTKASGIANLEDSEDLIGAEDFKLTICHDTQVRDIQLRRSIEAEDASATLHQVVAVHFGAGDDHTPTELAASHPADGDAAAPQEAPALTVSAEELATIRRMPIIFSSPDWSISGVNVLSEVLVRELNAAGFNAKVLISSHRDVLDGRHLPTVPFDFLGCTNNSYYERWEALRSYLAENSPCIYVPGYDFAMSALSPILPDDVAIVGVVHSDDELHYEHVNRLGRYWNAIVCVSSYLKQQVCEINPSFAPRTHRIHNGIELPSPMPKLPRSSNEMLRIITTGRLEELQKRVSDIPKIADALVARDVPFQITIVGDGEASGNLQRTLRTHLRRGRVRMPGRLPSEEVDRELLQHSIFLLCSNFEGMPLSLLEAMARGLVPVVTHIKSGVPEIVRDCDNGFLVPIGDINIFAERLEELYRNRSLLGGMSRAARRTVAECGFDARTMATRYGELFARLGAEILRGEYHRPRPFCYRAEFARILLPPWMQCHPDLTHETRA